MRNDRNIKVFVFGFGKAAHISVSAMGIYKLYLNGTPVDRDVLSPGWTDYGKRIPFYRYDVTEGMRCGKNVIGALLGDGWAVGKIAWFGRKKYAEKPSLWFELEVLYADGTSEIFGSDESVKVSEGAEKRNDILDGEYVDGREGVRIIDEGRLSVVVLFGRQRRDDDVGAVEQFFLSERLCRSENEQFQPLRARSGRGVAV